MRAKHAAELRRLLIGYRLSQAIVVAAELGLADHLASGPQTPESLATKLGVDPTALYRVMRLLASEAIFKEEPDHTFQLTPLADLLRTDVPESLKERALFDGLELSWRSWGNLVKAVRNGEPAIQHTYGEGLFAQLSHDALAEARFGALMEAQTQASGKEIVAAIDVDGAERIVDVGGGYGALLRAILDVHDHMSGVLFDRPSVIHALSMRTASTLVHNRCELVAGDFFESVPGGYDLYLMKYILHDWDDTRCKIILDNLRSAVGVRGRLVVIEALIPPGNEPSYAKYLDLNMLVLTGGRERTEAEYGDLLGRSGFVITRIRPTGSELRVIECEAM
jgi:hypothetical protein